MGVKVGRVVWSGSRGRNFDPHTTTLDTTIKCYHVLLFPSKTTLCGFVLDCWSRDLTPNELVTPTWCATLKLTANWGNQRKIIEFKLRDVNFWLENENGMGLKVIKLVECTFNYKGLRQQNHSLLNFVLGHGINSDLVEVLSISRAALDIFHAFKKI